MKPGDPTLAPEYIGVSVTPVIPEHELMHPIASGAYGQVWLARNKLGVLRAVKIVHRASFDHDRPFEREFAGIKAFEPISRSHEGFVDLLQVGRDDHAGYFYYIMELADDATKNPKTESRNSKENRITEEEAATSPETVRASSFDIPSDFGIRPSDLYVPRTLASELKRRGRLPLEECIQIGLALAEALAHLHRQGLIFISGVPKLADVGLVAGVGETRSFVGTEGFIPPEGPGTPQADLYSLGIVLYVLSTGKSHQDFPEPPAEIYTQENHAQWLEFDAVIHKACQARVSDRYQSAEEMLAELALLRSGQSVKAERASRRRWRIARKTALVTALLALLLVPLRFLKHSSHGHTPNPEAVRLYKLGRWHYSQLTPADHAKALQYFSLATQVDPEFVQPYGEWMMLYAWNQVPDSSTEQQRLQHVRKIADKALAIDPNAAEGHTALSWYKFLQRDWRGAEDEIQRAILLNPNLPMAHAVYCFYLSMQGRTDEARREGRKAEALEPPGSARLMAIVASWPFIADRRFDLAIAQLQHVLELDRNFSWGHRFLADCYDCQSNYVAAIEEYRTCAQLLGQDNARVKTSFDALRRAYEEQGDAGYLKKWIEMMRADEVLPPNEQLFGAYDIAGYYARLGEKEKALDEITTHFDEPNNWHQIKFIAMYDSLHDEPRFKALVRQARLTP